MTERFGWHPEPPLVGYRDEAEARAALEELGRLIWATALDHVYGEAMERPVAPATYPEMRRRFFGPSDEPPPAPSAPTPAAEVLAEFRDRVAPLLYNAPHPGQFGYFTPAPLPMSVGGEVLAQWANQGVDIWAMGPAGALVEEEVVSWLRGLVGYGEGSWGVLTSGGVMANIMGMTLARDVHLRRLRGLDRPPRGAELEGARVYASDQTHFSIERALGVLGFPEGTLRILPSDDAFRLHGAPVAEAVAEDRAAGLLPFAVAGVSGSTNTGSVDLVAELADVAEREDLWLHVDAAYGGGALLSERDAPRVPDLRRADSVTIDPHKWLFQTYDIGGLLVRRREDLRETFHRMPEYYRHTRPQDEPLNWYQYSIEGTRRFRGLKLWCSWKHLGTRGLGRLVETNDDLAAHLARQCREAPDLEALPPEPELSVVCFRHVPPGLEGERLDAYQDRLQHALETSGVGWVSTTRLRGATYLRAGIINHLSTEADVDRVLEALRALSAEVVASP